MAGAGLLAAQTAAPAKPPAGKTLPASAAAETAPVERKRPVRNPELYSTTVELLSQGEAARDAAYARALVQVVISSPDAPMPAANPVIRGALANCAEVGAEQQCQSDRLDTKAIPWSAVRRC